MTKRRERGRTTRLHNHCHWQQ